MANENARTEPQERAKKLADAIMGRRSTNDAVNDIIANASVTGNDRVNEEGPQPKRVIQSRKQDDNQDIDDEVDDEIDDQSEPDEDDEEVDDAPDEEEDQEDDADEEEDDAYEELAYNDDDVFEVKVDGETREVSLRDLLAAYSGEGAIQKRLKEAAELRKAAQIERDSYVQQTEEHRTNLLRTLSALDEALFLPLVKKPPAALRTKNMNEYLLQQDAYEEDQKRIADSRNKLKLFFDDQQRIQNEARMNYRNEQQERLLEKMPELRDPKRGPKAQADIMMAANHYGFTAEQVAQVDNHGLFLMARDAARWLNLQKIKQNGKGSVTGNATRKRKIRSGGGAVAQTKMKALASDKQKKQAANRAQATGKVEDVTSLLISNVRKRQGANPNGRSR